MILKSKRSDNILLYLQFNANMATLYFRSVYMARNLASHSPTYEFVNNQNLNYNLPQILYMKSELKNLLYKQDVFSSSTISYC